MKKKNKKKEKPEKENTLENGQIVFLGNIYGLHDGYDGSVFSINGICPTLLVHGNRCVIENERIRSIDTDWWRAKKSGCKE